MALAVLPDWRTNVVGATGDGSYSVADGVFTVNVSGEDIEGTKDDFFFVHKPLNGDGQIVARPLGLLPADPNSEAGVMLRDGTNSGARHVFLPLDEGKHVSFRRRLVENDYAVETGNSGTNWTWLRLMRLGDTFVGHASTNGTVWSLVWWTKVLNMPTNLEASLAVTAHKNGAMATAQLDNVSTGPLTPLPGSGRKPGHASAWVARVVQRRNSSAWAALRRWSAAWWASDTPSRVVQTWRRQWRRGCMSAR